MKVNPAQVELLDRLQAALIAGGFLARSVPFADCVDNRLAEEVVQAGDDD